MDSVNLVSRWPLPFLGAQSNSFGHQLKSFGGRLWTHQSVLLWHSVGASFVGSCQCRLGCFIGTAFFLLFHVAKKSASSPSPILDSDAISKTLYTLLIAFISLLFFSFRISASAFSLVFLVLLIKMLRNCFWYFRLKLMPTHLGVFEVPWEKFSAVKRECTLWGLPPSVFDMDYSQLHN